MNGPDSARFVEMAQWVKSLGRVLLVTHAKPDGDALGSLLGLRALLKNVGITATPLLYEPISSRYGSLASRFAPISVLETEVSQADLSGFDGMILLDTCAYRQMEPISDFLHAGDVPKLAVDHHVTRDDLADRYLIDESASANCLILHEWAKAAGWTIDAEAAGALFTGLAMDTGWFRHANTDSRTLAAAGDLCNLGASPYRIFEELFQDETVGRVRLLGRAIESMEILADGRLAIMTLSKVDFDESGAGSADTEDIVNEPLRIGSVWVSVLLVDQGDGLIRTSFRSKPPPGKTTTDVDVAAIAQHFGGGGHTRAAGARITGSLPEVHAAIAQQITGLLEA